jgi:hypothetical protein
MTNIEKIEAIREACIQCNPSIKDLVFGCHVLVKPKGNVFSATILDRNYAGNYLLKMLGMGTTATFKEKAIVKIIGRDVQLSDVLMAIGDKIAVVGSKSSMGCFVEWKCKTEWGTSGSWWNNKNILWNLLKPLHLQDEPTINFLYELI